MRTCFAFLLVAVSAAACAGQTADTDVDSDLDAPVGKADASSVPGGDYTNPTPHFGELSTVTLDADHTFTRTAIQACPGGGTCAPRTETGTYLLTHSKTRRYVHFYTTSGKSIDKYQWQLSLSKLSLNLEGDNEWFDLAQAAPAEDNSCEAAADCSGGLPHFCRVCDNGESSCAHWSCLENACQITSCD